MKKILNYIIQYPIELLVVFVVATGLICFPAAISAAIFVLTGVVLAYSLFFSKKKELKISSVILLLIIIFIYYYVTQKEASDLSIILACATSIAMAYFFGRANATNQNQKKAAKKMLIVSSIIISLMPYVFSIFFQISTNIESEKMESKMAGINQTINDGLVSIKNQTEKYSSDVFIIQLLLENKFEDLNNYCQNLKTSQNLDYLAVADEKGKFILRSDYPDLVGSDIDDIFPEFTKNSEINGVFHNDNNIFAAYGKSIQIEEHAKPIGWIIFGRNIDNSYLKNSIDDSDQIAMYYQGLVFPSASKSFSSRIVQEAINQGVVNENSDKVLFDYDSKRYILINNFIDCCTANLLLFHEYRTNNFSYIYGLITIILFIIIISAIYTYFENRKQGIRYRITQFFRNFKKQGGFVSFIYIVELILLSGVVLLVWHQSHKIFYEESFDIATVEKHEVSSSVQLYNFILHTDKFVKTGDLAKTEIKISNYPVGNNSIQAEIHFSKQYLEAKDIIINTTICNKIHENTIDNNTGILRLSCDMNQTGSGDVKEQLLATITFGAKTQGWGDIKIDDNYSFIITVKGTLKSIYQSSSDGEKVLVY